jgi:hypothetical protein
VRRERCVQRDGRVGVEDAHAVRADHPHPRAADQAGEPLLRRPAVRRDLGEARGDDDDAAHVEGGAVGDDTLDERGRHGDDDEVDRLPDRAEARIGGDPLDLARLRVHWVDRAREAGAHEVRDERAADRSRVARRADDRDGARLEEAPHALGGGMEPAGECGFPRAVRLLGRERQVHDARVARALHDEPRRGEHVQHLVVLAEDVGAELLDPGAPRDAEEVVEQDRADAAPLVRVGDRERDLGGARRPGHEA